MQSSYTAHVDRIPQDYKTEFTTLQKSKEQLDRKIRSYLIYWNKNMGAWFVTGGIAETPNNI